jgi:hypothetical protein
MDVVGDEKAYLITLTAGNRHHDILPFSKSCILWGSVIDSRNSLSTF